MGQFHFDWDRGQQKGFLLASVIGLVVFYVLRLTKIFIPVSAKWRGLHLYQNKNFFWVLLTAYELLANILRDKLWKSLLSCGAVDGNE